MSQSSEPARSPQNGIGESRSSQSRECDPAKCTLPCCTRFSISTENKRSQNNSHHPPSLPRSSLRTYVPSPLRPSYSPLPTPAPTISHAMPQIYQPRPQQPVQSASSSHPHRPTTPHRPPSRSEQLLREALMKDEHERNPLPSAPVRAHQRRHSHIPSTDHHRAEDLSRANFMYRSPVGPSSAASHQHQQPTSPSPASATLSRRHSQNQAPGHHHNPQRHEPSPYISTNASSPRRAHSPSVARRTSLSASQTPALSRRNIPQPLPLSPESYSPTEGLLPMTPHEQALKARLEQVLASDRTADIRRRHRESTEWMPTPTSPISSSSNSFEEEDDDDDNHVVDENGGRALASHRRRSTQPQPSLQGSTRKSAGAGLSSASSGSISARSGSREEMLSLASGRQRSRTEPALMVSAAHRYPSPKRTSTAPAFHLYPSSSPQHHRRGGRSGTTPPLVSDGSPTPEEEEEDEEEEEEDPEDSRLITPPPTPPSHAPYTQAKEYMPSPYVTSFDHRRGHHLGPLKSARTYSDEDVDDADVEEGSEEGYARRPSRHYGTLSASSHRPHHHHHHHPRSASAYHAQPPPSAGHPDQHRPQQFNVRRASERCKEIDGFVSFAAIEGLGAPVELDSEEEEEEKRRKEMEERAKRGGGVGDLFRMAKRRLLGEAAPVPPPSQCVL